MRHDVYMYFGVYMLVYMVRHVSLILQCNRLASYMLRVTLHNRCFLHMFQYAKYDSHIYLIFVIYKHVSFEFKFNTVA